LWKSQTFVIPKRGFIARGICFVLMLLAAKAGRSRFLTQKRVRNDKVGEGVRRGRVCRKPNAPTFVIPKHGFIARGICCVLMPLAVQRQAEADSSPKKPGSE
jgi:hypothetical protein